VDGRAIRQRRKPRILFLNRSYWPDSEATGQLLTQLCEDLAVEFDVRVLAGHPGVVEEHVTWNRIGREHRHGVEIHRVRHLHFAKHSLVGRVFNMCSFTVSAFFWTIFCRRPDVVVAETDPFLLPFIALWAKVRHRCRFVAYLQDIYPDIAVAVEKVPEGLLTRFLRAALWTTYRFADRLIVISEDMRDRCLRNGARAAQLEIIRNWADTHAIVPINGPNRFRRRHNLDGAFVVMYSGNHGLAHELLPIIDAAAVLAKSDPHIVFAFVGGGVRRQALEDAAAERKLPNVRFFPYQPTSELAHSLGAANVHLLSVKPQAHDCMSPSKLYGILAAQKPVVALLDPRSRDAQLLERHRVGVICDITDLAGSGEQLAAILAALAKNPQAVEVMGRNARALAVREFDRKLQTSRFAHMLMGTLQRSAAQRSWGELPLEQDLLSSAGGGELPAPIVDRGSRKPATVRVRN
jgi:glycosyltransferase involved in cell wall biosynthesis